MRFLCLHGIGSSAQVFETQLSALTAGLGSRYEFVFLQGDIPSEAGPGESDENTSRQSLIVA